MGLVKPRASAPEPVEPMGRRLRPKGLPGFLVTAARKCATARSKRCVRPERAEALLPALGSSMDPDVRIFAILLAADLGGEQAMASLLDLLAKEGDAKVCAAAAEVLAEGGDDAALSTLEDLANRFAGEPFVRFAIGVAITRLRAN